MESKLIRVSIPSDAELFREFLTSREKPFVDLEVKINNQIMFSENVVITRIGSDSGNIDCDFLKLDKIHLNQDNISSQKEENVLGDIEYLLGCELEDIKKIHATSTHFCREDEKKMRALFDSFKASVAKLKYETNKIIHS